MEYAFMYPQRRDLAWEACERGDRSRQEPRGNARRCCGFGAVSRESGKSHPAKHNVQPPPAGIRLIAAMARMPGEKYSSLFSFLFSRNGNKRRAGLERDVASARSPTRWRSYSCPTTNGAGGSSGGSLGPACGPGGTR